MAMAEPEEGRWRRDEDDDKAGGRSGDLTRTTTETEEGPVK
jgi:hypothetical protein